MDGLYIKFRHPLDGSQYTSTVNSYANALCGAKPLCLLLAYSGPGRIIDQIQLLNKEIYALMNEIEAQAKLILKHQRKIQELE